MSAAAATHPDWPRHVPAAPAPAGMARRGTWLALTAAVCATHLWLADAVLEDRFGWGQGETPSRRIEVAFVKELQQSAAPAVAPAPGPKGGQAAHRLPAVAATPASAPASLPEAAEPPLQVASAPEPDSTEPRVADAPASTMRTELASPLPVPMPEVAASAPAVAAPVAAAASAPQRQPFDWPPSTRLTYLLTGNYRGPVEGRASVEWLRSGERYQVHLEASVAPFLSRRLVSEGELTADGLVPRFLSGEQRVLLRSPRRWSLKFGPERIVLADGREVDTMPGAQDEASQFVQLTWLFTTQPELLQVGRSVDMPLALSRRLDRWTFDVVAEEVLQFPFGNVPTFHVKPRREAKGGDMTAQMWVAPTLQYLPVRIRIHQDEVTWIDMMLEKPPLQAAR